MDLVLVSLSPACTFSVSSTGSVSATEGPGRKPSHTQLPADYPVTRSPKHETGKGEGGKNLCMLKKDLPAF